MHLTFAVSDAAVVALSSYHLGEELGRPPPLPVKNMLMALANGKNVERKQKSNSKCVYYYFGVTLQ